MPAYNSFNLATQGRNGQPNITTNYYNGIARPNPIGDQLGNQTAVQPRSTTTTPLTGTAAPTNRNPYGSSGFNIENTFANIGATGGRVDPRLYNYGYNQFDQSEGGTYRTLGNDNVNERGLIRRNGSEYAQVGEAMHKVIDPSKVFYDEEFGYLTDPSNINNPDSGATRFATWAVPLALGGITAASALGAGGAAAGGVGSEWAAGGGFGAGGIAPEAAAGSGLGVSGTTAAGAGTLAETGGTWSSASGLAPPTSAVGPVAGPVGYEGAAAGATAAGSGGGGISGALSNPLLRSAAGNILGGIANAYLGNRAQSQANDAANRADTWGEDGRNFAKQKLFELYNDPSSVENTPGYKFRQQQGEQGINRTAAKTGYFRSPNMLYDLSKFNQDLAQTTWNDEFNKYAQMAGLSFNPSTAASMQQQGAQRSDNMRAASITQIIGAGGNFFDWLNSVG